MTLELRQASETDVERIADIHLAAFDSNPLLHVQFPTPSSLEGLKEVLHNDTLQSIQLGESSGKVVLVVTDRSAGGKVISFAKWDLPSYGTNEGIHHEISWPAGSRTEYLEGYTALAEAMKVKVLGDTKCYRMTFVGTDPEHEGRGAATMLTQWGLEKAERDKIPVYLESTENAVSLYEKLGLIRCDKLSMDMPTTSRDGDAHVYTEYGMLRRWE